MVRERRREELGGNEMVEVGEQQRESKEKDSLIKGAIMGLRNLVLGKFPGIHKEYPS